MRPDERSGRVRQTPVCRVAKWTGVNTLSIFVRSNQGGTETTRVSKIVLSGNAVQGMNVGDIKKGDE